MMQGKKTKSRAILLSVLVALLSLTVILGATFALFTAKSEYEIGVNTGKIDVQGELSLDKAWSQEQGGARVEATIADAATSVEVDQGGIVTIDGASITFRNMSLGDGAAFTLDITNHSTVKMQYSVYAYAETAGGETLRDNLIVKVGDTDLALGERSVYLQPWTKVEEAAAVTSLAFEISLPWSALNAFEGVTEPQSITLNIVLEAVQANAQTADVTASVGNAADLQNAINAAEAGEEVQITLTESMNLTSGQLSVPDGVSVDLNGNGETITFANKVFNNAGVDGDNLDGVGKDASIVIRNVNFVGPGTGTGFAVVLGPSEIGYAQVVLEDCSFTDMWGAVYCTAVNNATVNLTIRNCTYTNTSYGYSIDTTSSLTDPDTFKANVTFTGNTGWNVEDEFAVNKTVASEAGLVDALNKVASGADVTITLAAGTEIDLTENGAGEIALPEDAGTITIDGNNATIKSDYHFFNNAGTNGNNLDGIGENAKLVIKNVHFIGSGGDNGGYAVIIGPSAVGDTEVTFDNCTFEDLRAAIYCGGAEAGANVSITIKNCIYVDTKYGYGDWEAGHPDATVTIVFENNTTDETYVKEDEFPLQ